jgi:Rrf2 family protein
MIEIAMDTGGHGVLQKDIAVNQEISIKYLDSIIHSLKVAGLISNAKGKKSGYVLTKHPSKISIYDVHRAFEPDICVVDCIGPNMQCQRGNKCVVWNFWTGLNRLIIDYMSRNTLADLISTTQRQIIPIKSLFHSQQYFKKTFNQNI